MAAEQARFGKDRNMVKQILHSWDAKRKYRRVCNCFVISKKRLTPLNRVNLIWNLVQSLQNVCEQSKAEIFAIQVCRTPSWIVHFRFTCSVLMLVPLGWQSRAYKYSFKAFIMTIQSAIQWDKYKHRTGKPPLNSSIAVGIWLPSSLETEIGYH